MSYKTETHQNIAVWARRFKVEITNLDNAANAALKLYGGIVSRKAAIAVVAMKPVAAIIGRDLKHETTIMVGDIVARIVYNVCHGEPDANVHLTFRKEMKLLLDERRLTEDEFLASASCENKLIDLALDAIAARNAERARPSIANRILGKIR